MLAAVFAATTLLSAALLFAAQPMLGKALLAPFGGGAAVWTAVMLFFQIALLAGGVLFHAAVRLLGARLAALALIGCTALGALLLPAMPSARETGWGPGIDVLATLAAGHGVAMLAMGANAAALQSWYARRAGAAPWWLYVVSNVGSLAGLLAYPILIEPFFGLALQGNAWRALHAALLAALVAAAFLGLSGTAPGASRTSHAIKPGRRLRWIILAALPSSLLLGATQHITTAIAPLPLLWVLPLAAYLLSWTLAFRAPAWAARIGVPLFIVALPLALGEMGSPGIALSIPALAVALHVALVFAAGLLAHGRIAVLRPHPSAVSGFYPWLALGGALGGLANALLAPVLLDRPLEYSWALAALCLSLAQPMLPARRLLWCGIALIVAALPFLSGAFSQGTVATARDFYGALRVVEDADWVAMVHGNIQHGFAWRDPARALEPGGYYAREAGGGRLIAALTDGHVPGAPSLEGLVIGLGTGAMACLPSPALRLSFVEISPAVLRLARGYFPFLAGCGAPEVEIGDGRLRTALRPPASLDLLAIDAYGGDAVPAHLATAEAFALYRARLRPGGAILFHVSNQFLNLDPLIGAAAAANGLRALRYAGRAADGAHSVWIAASADPALQARLLASGWEEAPVAPSPWRDDRWGLLSALR